MKDSGEKELFVKMLLFCPSTFTIAIGFSPFQRLIAFVPNPPQLILTVIKNTPNVNGLQLDFQVFAIFRSLE